MRLAAIEVAGFRAFAETRSVDLSADAIILVGVNGSGKTSLCDAVLWALTGRVPRLGEGDGTIVSKYSPSGQARVSLALVGSDGGPYRIVRSFDGHEQQLMLEHGGRVVRQDEAKVRIVKDLWPTGLLTSDSGAAVTAATTRSVYLQQDLVRQFVEADKEQDRFSAVSELVGAGRVTEFQIQLERGKSAWTRATNARSRERDTVRERLVGLEGELAAISRMAPTADGEIEQKWSAWWQTAEALGARLAHPQNAAETEAAASVDACIKQLQTVRRTHERRYQTGSQLLAEIARQSSLAIPPDTTPLRIALEAGQRELALARQRMVEGEKLMAEIRRSQIARREEREELKTLAQLALRHLGEKCPVCLQSYSRDATRRRLEELAGVGTEEESAPGAPNISNLAAEVAEKERAVSASERALQLADRAVRERQAWLDEATARLRELGVGSMPESGGGEELRELIGRLATARDAVARHEREGEQLALGLAQEAQRFRKVELERELASVRRQAAEIEQFFSSREQTGAVAGQILDGLREAAAGVVQARLQRIEPLLQRIYARIDPHPAFRDVTFHSWLSYGRGHLVTRIDDSVANVSSDAPAVVLSSSQMNALAVSVFLAFNLGVPHLPLDAAILDDPLQSLDDVNLLGLIDLLRRTKDRRQLVVSTHDARFARLLVRKLRPIGEGQRTRVIEFEGWSRQGPIVHERDVTNDARPLRIVA